MVKTAVKSFVRENKFHSYLTRETLPVEDKVGILDDHEKTPSYQTFAYDPMRKFVLIGIKFHPPKPPRSRGTEME